MNEEILCNLLNEWRKLKKKTELYAQNLIPGKNLVFSNISSEDIMRQKEISEVLKKHIDKLNLTPVERHELFNE